MSAASASMETDSNADEIPTNAPPPPPADDDDELRFEEADDDDARSVNVIDMTISDDEGKAPASEPMAEEERPMGPGPRADPAALEAVDEGGIETSFRSTSWNTLWTSYRKKSRSYLPTRKS